MTELTDALAYGHSLLAQDPARAQARALEMLKSSPGNPRVLLLLAMAARRQGNLRQAGEILDALCRLPYATEEMFFERAHVLAEQGDLAEALATYETLVQKHPAAVRGWIARGNLCKTLGRQADAVAAFREAARLSPGLGEAWWSIANLKTVPFADDEVARMQKQLERSDLKADDRLHFEFALGKAFEDLGAEQTAFAHYRRANALRRQQLPYSAEAAHEFCDRLKRVLSRDLFAARMGTGAPAPDPIFIVGLPRSGSTLVEQILASHPAVEGTMELHEVAQIAHALAPWTRSPGAASYPEMLRDMPVAQFVTLGEAYIAATRKYRRANRPLFIDKMPNNFLHAGLIHLMLPNAKIIDVRRHPLACGLSCFKQHFARGQAFLYDLGDIGRYYADYVDLMAHYDAVLPGRIHHVFLERLLADPEGEIRRLLAYCGLAFDERCLHPERNTRAIHTASSEQVRQPIHAATDVSAFEPWLGPLKDALGVVLESYPY